MRKLIALTLFLTATSATAQVDLHVEWFSALNVFQLSAQTEIDVIRDQLTPPSTGNAAAVRKAQENRKAFIIQHHELYKISCSQMKPAKTPEQCSYAGHYAAERDLNAIAKMSDEELRNRIRYLQEVLEREQELRSGGAGLRKDELKLQWSALPSKRKAVTNKKHRVDFEAPRDFSVPKPGGISSATAVYDSGATKRLPGITPVESRGGGGSSLIFRPLKGD